MLNTADYRASLVAQRLKCLPSMQETQVQSLGQEDPLEKEMATHSSTLAWKIPWTVSCHLKTVRASFLIWIPFISFSSLIVVARTSRTMLNKSGESGHPCLVPDLRGNAFSFSPLRIMFAVGLSYMAFTMLR